MAKRVHIVLEDDLDGTDADETVTFGLDGVSYEIDLSAANAAALRDALAPYVGAGERVGGRRRSAGRTASPAKSGRGASTSSVRDWARANGHAVNDRGRIPASVQEAYDAAH